MKTFAVALFAAATFTGTSTMPAVAAVDADSPIDQARLASQTIPFTGVVAVQWRDDAGEHETRVSVKGADGTLVVAGGKALMARDTVRVLQQQTASTWELLWPSAFGPLTKPDPGSKYQLEVVAGALVAGRPTTRIDVRSSGKLRERLFLDNATNLLVRRDQLDQRGRVVRTVAFVDLTPGPAGPAPAFPTASATRTPTRADLSAVRAAAPTRLRDGYRRIGVYRQGHVVHVLYSDGLYQLSVFEQLGRLHRSQVPAGGRRADVAGVSGWRYTWAGGDVLLWQAGRSVYTLVGDAPIDELVQVAGSMPANGRSSLVRRVRSACRALLDGF